MPIAEQIDRDIVTAMKTKDADKLVPLRMAKAAFGLLAIEKKKDRLDDSEASQILQKLVKQRKESIESFEKAGRTELAAKEKKEAEILQAYLPKQLSDDEIKAAAQKAIAESGAKTKAEIGKVMKALMPAIQGKADGKRVNEILLSLLA